MKETKKKKLKGHFNIKKIATKRNNQKKKKKKQKLNRNFKKNKIQTKPKNQKKKKKKKHNFSPSVSN
jgi:hypothetical protein